MLLWVLRWALQTKALSHDPAPEGPLPVLTPRNMSATLDRSDQQLHLPFFVLLLLLLQQQQSSTLLCLTSGSSPVFSSSTIPQSFPSVPPSRNLLKTFPPSRSRTPFSPPSCSVTLPPWLAAQVSVQGRMPAIPGRSHVFNLTRARFLVLALPITHVSCIVCGAAGVPA